MIQIGQVISSVTTTARNIVTQIYEGFTITPRQMSLPGIDSNPIPSDTGLVLELDDSNGKYIQIGAYGDGSTLPGEIKIFSRLPDGTEQVSVYCDAAGLIEIKNSLTSLKTILDNFSTEGGPAKQFTSVATKLEIAKLLK